jgi:hypothetical protein
VSREKDAKTVRKIAVPVPPQMGAYPQRSPAVMVVNAKNAFAKPTHFAVNPHGMTSVPYNVKKIAVRIAAVLSPVVGTISAGWAKIALLAPMTVDNALPIAETTIAMILKPVKPVPMIAEPVPRTVVISIVAITKIA